MAWTRSRLNRRTGEITYTGLYRDLNGKTRSAGVYRTKAQALEIAKKMEQGWDATEGTMSPAEKATITLAEYVPHFLRHVDVEPNTHQHYTFILNRWVVRMPIGKLRVAEVEPPQLQRFMNEVRTRISPASAGQVRSIISAMFTMARNLDGIRTDNPMHGIKAGQSGARIIRVFSPEQFATFVKFLPNRPTRVLAYFIFSTGVRPGEAAALRISDVNFETKTVMINKAVKDADKAEHGKALVVSPYTKTGKVGKGWRSFPINSKCLEMLKQHIAEHDLRPDDLLFPAALIVGAANPFITREYTPEEVEALGVVEYRGRVYRHYDVLTYDHRVIRCRCNACRSKKSLEMAEKALANGTVRGVARTKAGRIEHFSPRVWGRIFSTAMQKMIDAGLAKYRVTAYELRHSHAWHMHSLGMPLQKISHRLGNNVPTLMKYYLGINGEAYSSEGDKEILESATIDCEI